MKAHLYADLEARGILKQLTSPELKGRLERTEPITLYVGFDPTSDSLHVGSLLPLVTMRRFQRAGHRVLAVVGGATGMIGDPSGKSQERSLLGEEQLERNVQGIKQVMMKFLELDDPKRGKLLNNGDWFKGLGYVNFLRDVGKHFTINHMIAKESVRARLEDREHGISYTEFSYMLLQAYDFLHLHKTEKCELQMGGSDQWGNITAGIELIRRARFAETGVPEPEGQDTVFGLTHPLVTKADGTKFGKTEAGTVWLDAERTSPYQFYQFWINTADADAPVFLKLFSERPIEEIKALEAQAAQAPEKRAIQRAMAEEMTSLVHGKDALERAQAAAGALFGGPELKTLDARTLADIFQGAPSSEQPRSALGAKSWLDLLVESGMFPSKGAARKEVQGGGVYVNNERLTEVEKSPNEQDLIAGQAIVLRRGKRNYHLIKFQA